MLSSKKIATDISEAGETFVAALSAALDAAKTSCTPDEFERLKRAVGSVIGTLEVDMLWPLYKQHPELEPETLRDWKNDET